MHRAHQGFSDRTQAGAALGLALATELPAGEYVVLGLLRGGVPIAAEVAHALGAALGALAVRKLGAPSNPELALGALAQYRGEEARVLNPELYRRASRSFGPDSLEDTETAARQKLSALSEKFADYAPELTDRIVVLCDDGLATGATMKAGLALVRKFQPAMLIAAVPVAAPAELDELSRYADRSFALIRPQEFNAVGAYYEDFTQVTEQRVHQLLRTAG